ncbi:hypothetical protein Emed_006020 [Eimeria media]
MEDEAAAATKAAASPSADKTRAEGESGSSSSPAAAAARAAAGDPKERETSASMQLENGAAGEGVAAAEGENEAPSRPLDSCRDSKAAAAAAKDSTSSTLAALGVELASPVGLSVHRTKSESQLAAAESPLQDQVFAAAAAALEASSCGTRGSLSSGLAAAAAAAEAMSTNHLTDKKGLGELGGLSLDSRWLDRQSAAAAAGVGAAAGSSGGGRSSSSSPAAEVAAADRGGGGGVLLEGLRRTRPARRAAGGLTASGSRRRAAAAAAAAAAAGAAAEGGPPVSGSLSLRSVEEGGGARVVARLPGVKYCQSRNAWIARWSEEGQERWKTFSVKACKGFTEARMQAVQFRWEKVRLKYAKLMKQATPQPGLIASSPSAQAGREALGGGPPEALDVEAEAAQLAAELQSYGRGAPLGGGGPSSRSQGPLQASSVPVNSRSSGSDSACNTPLAAAAAAAAEGVGGGHQGRQKRQGANAAASRLALLAEAELKAPPSEPSSKRQCQQQQQQQQEQLTASQWALLQQHLQQQATRMAAIDNNNNSSSSSSRGDEWVERERGSRRGSCKQQRANFAGAAFVKEDEGRRALGHAAAAAGGGGGVDSAAEAETRLCMQVLKWLQQVNEKQDASAVLHALRSLVREREGEPREQQHLAAATPRQSRQQQQQQQLLLHAGGSSSSNNKRSGDGGLLHVAAGTLGSGFVGGPLEAFEAGGGGPTIIQALHRAAVGCSELGSGVLPRADAPSTPKNLAEKVQTLARLLADKSALSSAAAAAAVAAAAGAAAGGCEEAADGGLAAQAVGGGGGGGVGLLSQWPSAAASSSSSSSALSDSAAAGESLASAASALSQRGSPSSSSSTAGGGGRGASLYSSSGGLFRGPPTDRSAAGAPPPCASEEGRDLQPWRRAVCVLLEDVLENCILEVGSQQRQGASPPSQERLQFAPMVGRLKALAARSCSKAELRPFLRLFARSIRLGVVPSKQSEDVQQLILDALGALDDVLATTRAPQQRLPSMVAARAGGGGALDSEAASSLTLLPAGSSFN